MTYTPYLNAYRIPATFGVSSSAEVLKLSKGVNLK